MTGSVTAPASGIMVMVRCGRILLGWNVVGRAMQEPDTLGPEEKCGMIGTCYFCGHHGVAYQTTGSQTGYYIPISI